MELGERLRQARQEAGLSQRQLCGDTITRNMLSQIENGSARPSMETLRYLAARLGKPMGYFLEEQAVTSHNLGVMERARQKEGQAVLEELESYEGPDTVFDRERWLLEALTCLDMAQTALKEGKKGYAASLLERAEKAGSRTSYYTPDLEKRRWLLSYEAGLMPAESVLPDEYELLVLAQAALEQNRLERCSSLLEAIDQRDEKWHYLRAQAYLQEKDFAKAAEHFLMAEDFAPQQVYAHLEHCYRELEDYKQAYFYACKQR